MSDNTINLTPDLYAYYQNISLREPKSLQKLRQQTHKMSMGHMQISPEQGQFMQFLVKLIKAKRTLEIGCFTGYSAMTVALALPENGKVITCDINAEWTKLAKKYWEMGKVSHKIELRLAPALETLQKLRKNSFDFAFIDADKKNYDAYYEQCLRLVRIGGLIAIDNVLWDGKVADEKYQDENTQAIRALNAKILKDKRVEMSMLPIGDGLTLVIKCGDVRKEYY